MIEVIAKPSNIPAITSGGCAVYALELHRRLNDLGVKSVIVYGSYSYCDDQYEDHKKREIRSCCHAFVRVNGEFYDGEGKMDKKFLYKRYPLLAPLPDWYVQATIERGGWNNTFEGMNGGRGVDKVKNYFNSIFNS